MNLFRHHYEAPRQYPWPRGYPWIASARKDHFCVQWLVLELEKHLLPVH